MEDYEVEPNPIKKNIPNEWPKKNAEEAENYLYSNQEVVDHPEHYQGTKYEVIDIIEDFKLNFNLGNVIKYILRAGKKDNQHQDLKKAMWYLEREITKEKKV